MPRSPRSVISALPEDDRRRADDVRHCPQLRRFPPSHRHAARFEDVDVRRRADDAVAQFALQSGHQRQRDEHRHARRP